MPKRIPGFLALRDALTFVALLLLLAAAVGLRENELIATLRGNSWLESELAETQPKGYYEHLIGDSDDAARKPNISAPDKEPPPKGVVVFSDAGIVQEEPTYLRWRMRPNLSTRWNGSVFHTNSLGYRTPEVAPKKPEGTYRIVMLGSSNTMGHGVNDDEAYPRHLERWLNERVGPKRRVEVVNLAVSGDSPTRRLERLRQDVARFDADWLLCDVTVFDFFLEEEHLQAIVPKNVPIPYDFVTSALQRAGITAATPLSSYHDRLLGEFKPLLDETYAAWSREAKQLGVPMTLVVLPRTDYEVRNAQVREMIQTLAHRHGLETFDLANAFEGLPTDRVQISSWDHHPNGLGQFAIFEALRAQLALRGTLPGRHPLEIGPLAR